LFAAYANALKTEMFSAVQLHVFPNPAQDFFTIHGLQNKTTLTLFTALGQVVLTQEVDNIRNTIVINQIPPGMYLYQLTQNQQMITGKIIIK